MNRVKVGFFSLSHHSATGDDRSYLRWHQMDHMPEQYQIPGMVLGQRWASTAACREVRAAEVGDWTEVEHVVCYLMGQPVDETIDEFLMLGRHLAELGRFAAALPSQYRGALRLLESHAAPRTLISDEVVPFRPHRGIYLMVEELTDRSAQDAFLRRLHTEILADLVSVEGVAGALTFATTPSIRRPSFSEGDRRITLCYLDESPAVVGGRLVPWIEEVWSGAPSRLLLAAPFESVTAWDWDRFGPDG